MLTTLYLCSTTLFIVAVAAGIDWTGETDMLNKTKFCALADESLIFAQARAELQGVPRAQIELWTISWRTKGAVLARDEETGQILPAQTNQLTRKAG